MSTLVSKYGKAIVGFIVAGLGSLYVVTALPGGITLHEWIGVALAALGTSAGVAITPRGTAATVADIAAAKAVVGAHEAP